MAKSSYDLVLMDKRMPRVDGLTLTRQIRRDPSIAQPFIVAVTASVLPEARAACMEAGIDAFLGKPVRLADLARILQIVAEKKVPSATELAALFDGEVLNQLLLCSADGSRILDRTADLILSELQTGLQALQIPRQRTDLAGVKTQAHGMAGSLRTIGATVAARCAADVEQAAEEGSVESTATAVERLRAAVADASRGFASFVAANSTSA